MSTLIAQFQNIKSYLMSGQIPQKGYWTYLLLALLVEVEGPIATFLGAAAAINAPGFGVHRCCSR